MTRESKEEQKKFEDFDGGEGSGAVSGKSVSGDSWMKGNVGKACSVMAGIGLC